MNQRPFSNTRPLGLHRSGSYRVWVGWFLSLIASATCGSEILAMPEAEQAAAASGILEAWRDSGATNVAPKLHVVYFTPSDRDPEPRYRERVDACLEDIQAFYRDGMQRCGFGDRTFLLDRDPEGRLVIHLVKGKLKESKYARSGFAQNTEADAAARDSILAESRPVLEAAGISPSRETILILCNLAKWDARKRTYSHHSPYCGGASREAGWCFAVDSEPIDVNQITNRGAFLKDAEWGRESLGKFNTIFIGGIAHELGHAFDLPHCGERRDEKSLGTSLMGAGNHTYRSELRGEGAGSFLTMASALRLASRPLFSGCSKGVTEESRLDSCQVVLSTNMTRPDLSGRPGALRIEGTVAGTPPVYGVIAYFDSLRDGGYHAPTATAVPDDEGRFAMEISDLTPCGSGDLRIQFCHVNGGVSGRRLQFAVNDAGEVDLSQWQMRLALEPITTALVENRAADVPVALTELEKSDAPELAKVIGRKLAGILDSATKLSPADVPDTVSMLSLGDAQPKSAKVGWIQPTSNFVPLDGGVRSPLLDCGRLYATGLYAHAPSIYVFDLDAKWKVLEGEAGLQADQQPFGSVIFIIKADGKEVFRSETIRGSTKAVYKLDMAGVRRLELIVDPDGPNHNDWGLWLDPVLRR